MELSSVPPLCKSHLLQVLLTESCSLTALSVGFCEKQHPAEQAPIAPSGVESTEVLQALLLQPVD